MCILYKSTYCIFLYILHIAQATHERTDQRTLDEQLVELSSSSMTTGQCGKVRALPPQPARGRVHQRDVGASQEGAMRTGEILVRYWPDTGLYRGDLNIYIYIYIYMYVYMYIYRL